MRDINTNSTTSFWQWKSPLPYLFGGLALTLALIVVALVLLACSFHKRRHSSAVSDEEKSVPRQVNITIEDMSPRIVVIMAGDQKPTHIGVPAVSSSYDKPSD